MVEVYRKPFHRRFERGQGFAKFLGWRQRWVSHGRHDSTSRWPIRSADHFPLSGLIRDTVLAAAPWPVKTLVGVAVVTREVAVEEEAMTECCCGGLYAEHGGARSLYCLPDGSTSVVRRVHQ